ncbi:hypothetical protein ACQY0O_003669 [Thecaphora frezii]
MATARACHHDLRVGEVVWLRLDRPIVDPAKPRWMVLHWPVFVEARDSNGRDYLVRLLCTDEATLARHWQLRPFFASLVAEALQADLAGLTQQQLARIADKHLPFQLLRCRPAFSEAYAMLQLALWKVWSLAPLCVPTVEGLYRGHDYLQRGDLVLLDIPDAGLAKLQLALRLHLDRALASGKAALTGSVPCVRRDAQYAIHVDAFFDGEGTETTVAGQLFEFRTCPSPLPAEDRVAATALQVPAGASPLSPEPASCRVKFSTRKIDFDYTPPRPLPEGFLLQSIPGSTTITGGERLVLRLPVEWISRRIHAAEIEDRNDLAWRLGTSGYLTPLERPVELLAGRNDALELALRSARGMIATRLDAFVDPYRHGLTCSLAIGGYCCDSVALQVDSGSDPAPDQCGPDNASQDGSETLYVSSEIDCDTASVPSPARPSRRGQRKVSFVEAPTLDGSAKVTKAKMDRRKAEPGSPYHLWHSQERRQSKKAEAGRRRFFGDDLER